MTVLTWKNVDAPDLSGSLEGFKTASQMFGNALNAAKTGIADVQEGQAKRATADVMSDIMSYQGRPDELTADMQSGALRARHGANWDKLSTSTLEAISKAPADFLAFAGDRLKFGEDQKKVADNDMVRSLREPMNTYLSMKNSKDPTEQEKAEAYRLANPALNQLSTDDFSRLLKGGSDLFGDALANDASVLSGTKNRWDFGNSVEEKELGIQAGALEGVLNRTLLPEQHLAELNKNFDSYAAQFNPRVVTAMINKLSGAQAGPGGGMIDATGGGAAGSSGVSGMPAGKLSSEAQRFATPANASALIQTARSIGADPAELATIISYETGGRFNPDTIGGKGNGYRGLIQFGEPERRQFGVTPGQSFESQLGSAAAFLKARGFKPGMGILDMYTIINTGSLNKDGSSYNKSDNGKDTVRSHVARMVKDHGGAAQAFLGMSGNARASQMLQDSIQASVMQDPDVQVALDFQDAWSSRDNATQVGAQLTGKGGTFEGENKDYVIAQIVKIRDKYKLNDKIAGMILARAREGEQSYFGRLGDSLPGSDGLRSEINDEKVEQFAKLAGDRAGLLRKTAGVRDKQAMVANMGAANAQADSVRQQYQQTVARLEARGLQMRPEDELMWQTKISNALGQQSGANQSAIPGAMDGVPVPQDGPDKTTGRTNRRVAAAPVRDTGSPALDVAPPAVYNQKKREFAGIIAGDIRRIAAASGGSNDLVGTTRVNAAFRKLYGMTTQQAAADPIRAMANRKRIEAQIAEGGRRRAIISGE